MRLVLVVGAAAAALFASAAWCAGDSSILRAFDRAPGAADAVHADVRCRGCGANSGTRRLAVTRDQHGRRLAAYLIRYPGPPPSPLRNPPPSTPEPWYCIVVMTSGIPGELDCA